MKIFSLISIFFLALVSMSVSSVMAKESEMMCTMEYAPVCASVEVQCIRAPCNPVRQTFSNGCMARAANATNITTGACETTVPPVVGGDRDSHGCIGSAGYTWDPLSSKCARPWENQKKTPRQALQDGTWVLDTFNGKVIAASGSLTFSKNKFTAKLCNNLAGEYGVLADTLIFRRVISTQMYCQGDIMAVENAWNFRRAKFMVGATELTVTTKKGDIIVWKKK